jgi:glycosyltransferase involved in cell wall biosynthesis
MNTGLKPFKRENIVIVHSLYDPYIIGGAEISTQILAETLAENYNVYVITLGPQRRSKGIVRDTINGVEVIRIPYSNLYWMADKDVKKTAMKKMLWHLIDIYNVFHYKTILQLLKQIQPIFVHTQNLMGFSTVVWTAASRLGIPIIHTLRDYFLFQPIRSSWYNRLHHRVTLRVSRHVSTAVGISAFILNKHVEKGYFQDADHQVIANVVTGEYRYKDHFTDGASLTLGYFGQLEANKGVSDLIQAVRKLPERIVGKLVICGDGTQRGELEQLAAGDKRIEFKGKLSVRDTKDMMAEVDLSVVPSRWDEPFGRVIIESYQVGTPVIAAHVGGIPDVILDKDDYLFEPGHIDSLTRLIEKFANSSKEQKRAICYQCVEHSKRFNKEGMLHQHLDTYEKLRYGYADKRIEGREVRSFQQ